MDCTVCETNKIDPESKPYGGFLCTNQHLQCSECSSKRPGFCQRCSASTKFLQMKFASPKSSEPHSSVFSREMSDEVETQSRLSKEHLSMNCSEQESYRPNACQTYDPETNDPALIGGSDERIVSNTECQNAEDLSKAKPQRISMFVGGNKSTKNTNMSSSEFDPSEATNLHVGDSSESFQNSETNSKYSEPASSACPKAEQLKRLSAEVLQYFDSKNSALKTEVVNNYLKSCGPTLFSMPPAYNCKQPNCRWGVEPTEPQLQPKMKSISISTESDPSLKSICLQTSERTTTGSGNPQDYLIMRTEDVTPAAQVADLLSDTDGSKYFPVIDMRMQKIFEILKEDVRINGLAGKPYTTKIPTPTIPAKEHEPKCTPSISCSEEDENRDVMDRLSSTYRANYNLPLPLPLPYVARASNLNSLFKLHPAQQKPPLPQFQRVACPKAMARELLKQTDFANFKRVPADLLHIPRSPIICPESTCQRMIFVSDFSKHLVVDHSHLPIERISPFQCKNFFLDVRLFKNGASKCHLLYLMCDKIVGLGSTEYKDFLPLLVMTSRISLRQMCEFRSPIPSAPEYFLIWVTGIAPAKLSVSVALTVWSQAGRAGPGCHIVYSGNMYSVRNSQCPLKVWQSGRTLLLSSQEIAALTNNGSEMLNLQLSVH